MLKRLTLALILALAQAVPAPAAPRLPDGHTQAVLIYGTIAALDQANATGNYAVLRALAAPAFQERNSADALAQVFAAYRAQRVRLGEAILFEPRLERAPALDKDGILRLAGHFPTSPLRITFDLSFVEIGGDWRLIAISIRPQAG